MPSDPDYQDTKLVKQGKKTLVSPLLDIVEWADAKFEVKFLNAFCDVIQVKHADWPRLNMILERDADKPKFQKGWNFDEVAQAQVREAFQGILAKQKIRMEDLFRTKASPKPKGPLEQVGDLFTGKWSSIPEKPEDPPSDKPLDHKDLLVIFSTFEPVAKVEANQKIPQEKVVELQARLGRKDLWTIEKAFTNPIFFFYTAAQAEAARADGSLAKMGEAYFDLLAPYDEFKYFDCKVFKATADSKEVFDTKYNGSWFNYYR